MEILWDWINGKTEDFEQRMFERGNQELMKPIGSWVKGGLQDLWAWFIDVLPEIAGYGVMATGAFIMIAPLVSRGGLMKPLSFMVGGLIVTVCILATQ